MSNYHPAKNVLHFPNDFFHPLAPIQTQAQHCSTMELGKITMFRGKLLVTA
jgi:hypothetical protein